MLSLTLAMRSAKKGGVRWHSVLCDKAKCLMNARLLPGYASVAFE